MKLKFKQFLAVFMCICILLPSLVTILPIIFTIMPVPIPKVYAEDYETDNDYVDEETGTIYYIIKGANLNELFDFEVKDALKGQQALDFITTFKSYTVIGRKANGEYAFFFNAPTIQTNLKDRLISKINDGYTDDTYDVNETQWIVDVGETDKDSEFSFEKENVISKYGFAVPSPTYMGEYPKLAMSTANIIPRSGWAKIWRGIKSFFTGCSFLDAPDASSFKTITYLNHTYKDRNEWIIEAFMDYFMIYCMGWVAYDGNGQGQQPYMYTENVQYSGGGNVVGSMANYDWENKTDYAPKIKKYNDYKKEAEVYGVTIPELSPGNYPYFTSAQDLIEKTVTDAEKDAAVKWLNEHVKEREEAHFLEDTYNAYVGCGTTTETVTLNGSDTVTITYNGFINNNGDFERFRTEFLFNHELSDERNASYIEAYNSAMKIQIVQQAMKASGLQANPEERGEDIVNAVAHPPYIVYKPNPEEVPDGTDKDGKPKTKKVTKPPAIIATGAFDGSMGTFLGYNYDGNTSHRIPLSRIQAALDYLDVFVKYDFQRNNFLTEFDEYILQKEAECQRTIYNYFVFLITFSEGDETTKKNPIIAYRQCLIKSEKEEQCISKKYGEKTTITIASLYAYSGLYKICEDPANHPKRESDGTPNPYKLTRAGAIKTIQHIQNYCGPYYTEVLQNLIKLMGKTMPNGSGTSNELNELISNKCADPRIMPYDVSSLSKGDMINYTIKDPRVELYKDHIVGGIISDLTLNWGFSVYIKPQKTLINLGGKITEIAIFFQRLCSLDKLDEWGLSPTTMWQNGFIALVMAFVALYFIVVTVYSIIKMGTRSASKIILGFIVLLLELGFFTLLINNPQRVWNKTKTIVTKVSNLGEEIGKDRFDNYGLDYLYASASNTEVTYYLPYLDMWSKYNTGYGMLADEQLIVPDGQTDLPDLPELKEIEELPTINGNNINHYSVLLMDAISYYGKGNSVSGITVKDENGQLITYNGSTINNNAYRVVDHFLAPRVKVVGEGVEALKGYNTIEQLYQAMLNGSIGNALEKPINLEFSENENYNGEFQSGFIDIIVKLLNCLLAAFLSLIKFLVFIWQWFMFYIFIFRVVLSKTEHKNWRDILVETFSPVLCLVFLGIYSSLAIWLGMSIDGIIGLGLMLAMFWVTFQIILIWKDLRRGTLFPQTLKPVAYILESIFKHRKGLDTTAEEEINVEDMSLDTIKDARDIGFEFESEEDVLDFAKFTELLFDADGNMKSHDNQIYKDWFMRADYEIKQHYKGDPNLLPEQQRKAYFTYLNEIGEKEANALRKDRDHKYKGKKTNRDDIGMGNADLRKKRKAEEYEADKNKKKEKQKKNQNNDNNEDTEDTEDGYEQDNPSEDNTEDNTSE